jgi:DNA modification methylase
VARLRLRSRHRLVCGDSTSVDSIDAAMDGQIADLVFTSPPYAQQRDYGAAKEKVSNWDALMFGVFSVLPTKAGAQVLVNLGLVHRDGEWMREAGWRRFGWYVWDQGPGLPGDWNGRLAPSHEFIFHFNRESRKPNKTVESKHGGQKIGGGGLRGKDGVVKEKTGAGRVSGTHRIPDSVLRVMRHKGKVDGGSHPAVFPVALVEEVLAAYAKAGDVVFEPFCGSGTQIIAAEKSNVRCFAVELDPTYCDVAVRRFLNFSGSDCILESTGQSFAEIAERGRAT